MRCLSSDSGEAALGDAAEASQLRRGRVRRVGLTFPTCWVSRVVMNRGSLKGKGKVKAHGTAFVGSSAGRTRVSMATKVGSREPQRQPSCTRS